ncbi:MAG TPA: CHRD domain-containing protein [Pyrinomonadaceae bacterium]|nr:CHRD domain-containing protein [Pyrinomonadaceae bacterium]
MKRVAIVLCLVAFATAGVLAVPQGFKVIKEFLTGYEEVPALSTTGNGVFNAKISSDESRIEWQLSYADLESAVQQAHIHIGNVSVNGGITVFLCTNLGNGPAGIQPCPPAPATISGVIEADDVSPNIPATAGGRGQGIDTGEIDELIAAMRAGATYVNVHTTVRTGGEIRAQIGGDRGHGH